MDLAILTKKTNRAGTVYYESNDGSIVAKVCSKCEETKPLDDYPKSKTKLGGRQSECKLCKRVRSAKEREENPEYFREYRKINKEPIAESTRNWYLDNRDMVLSRCEANKERRAENFNRWRSNNLGRRLLTEQRRRARKHSLPDTFTNEQLNETLSYFNGGCALTGDASVFHWDHVIPLATERGGTIHGNMIPLRADLNLSKSDANIFEWFESNKARFDLSQSKFDSLIDWLASINGMTVEEYRDYVYDRHNDGIESVG